MLEWEESFALGDTAVKHVTLGFALAPHLPRTCPKRELPPR